MGIEKKGKKTTDTEEKRTGLGLKLAKQYYEECVKPMLQSQFAAFEDKIAVGLAGRGSDCFGFDDETSRDHDWGPEVCLWLTDETYEQIGEALEQAYGSLPAEWMGYQRAPHVNGKNRRGVMRISDFYRSFLDTAEYEAIDWTQVKDSSLAAAVNGEIFRDEEGVFLSLREKLQSGYPEAIRNLKLADSMQRFAQAAQYNLERMWRRGEQTLVLILLADGLKEAMKIQHYIEGKYPPHDKWLMVSLRETVRGREAADKIEKIQHSYLTMSGSIEKTLELVEELADYFVRQLYQQDFISDIDPYLDAHSKELVWKAAYLNKEKEELVEEIARLEFEAFDQVQNEGGRASCQNDWTTFSIMRKSQYLTWDKTMLLQYLYDFHREYQRGHNLITEKYGRMMESTAPKQYEELKQYFPQLSEEKKAIIEQICALQVGWMEEFAKRFPALADNTRRIRTSEDNPFSTSYETYLRGEIGTYSDKMLELYGRYIVRYAKEQRNLAADIMENSVRMYGYQSLEEAEQKYEG